MKNGWISILLMVGLLFSLVSGCAMMAEPPESTEGATSSAQTTLPSQTPTASPTAPSEEAMAPYGFAHRAIANPTSRN